MCSKNKYMLKLMLCIAGINSFVSCQQSWVNRAKYEDHSVYYNKLMQATLYRIEELGWSNLKLQNQTQTLNEQMYSWLVAGTLNYTNGFLVSIQRVDLTNIQQIFSSSTIANVTTAMGMISGIMNLRDVNIGYDVEVQLDDGSKHMFTGTFLYTAITMLCSITKDFTTKALTVASRFNSISGGLHRMVYMPETNLTEVISRRYVSSGISSSVSEWGTNVIAPIMLDIATNDIPLPKVCFDC